MLGDKGEPEVLRMSRETFDGLDWRTKKKLTKELSAEEWNRLLKNFWDDDVEYKKNVSILYHTLNYSVKK